MCASQEKRRAHGNAPSRQHGERAELFLFCIVICIYAYKYIYIYIYIAYMHVTLYVRISVCLCLRVLAYYRCFLEEQEEKELRRFCVLLRHYAKRHNEYGRNIDYGEEI
ncbi:hypothetical protein, unlikely [Trypanosoma brucei gambiense DAL972]|uniref:Uncharacterized protein n=1 Tax=Trypanosoma brucei gambiense (strain MHOM/CI/86/DAL972) TaxID=679716 RepID=D0A9K6_TRYB9|nr:hypothetical protein, unlikely [Trypanosoma brucei gambiense DAL972]CBH18357.1 hypothetical protein, unlikely [Trypanosoma brucei gambiense DAL972]|eukprot:XP_011780621.1 hypothetical protein, unlikely [Trypanosoma brucei gambiense DAL972]